MTFHSYDSLLLLEKRVAHLRETGRPLLCTEWMRRGFDSQCGTHLAYFRQKKVACPHWGLVNGKTQTHFPWGSPVNAPEPNLWFHDLLRTSGVPYDAEEVDLIKKTIHAHLNPPLPQTINR